MSRVFYASVHVSRSLFARIAETTTLTSRFDATIAQRQHVSAHARSIQTATSGSCHPLEIAPSAPSAISATGRMMSIRRRLTPTCTALLRRRKSHCSVASVGMELPQRPLLPSVRVSFVLCLGMSHMPWAAQSELQANEEKAALVTDGGIAMFDGNPTTV